MPQYRIRGAHADTGEAANLTVTAENDAEAEAVASHRKVLVERITEVEPNAPQAPRVSQVPGGSEAVEVVLWSGRPSQLGVVVAGIKGAAVLLVVLVACFFVPPLLIFWGLGMILLAAYLLLAAVKTRFTGFEVTTQRIKLSRGMIARRLDDVELYRVKETRLSQGVLDRMLGLGSVVMATSDTSQAEVVFYSIPDPVTVRETIREHSETRRDRKRVRDVELT